jgi:hypothetical protein
MATRRWTGTALAKKQVTTIAVTGTWATGDTATITINGNDLVVTIGAAAAIADVAAAIVAAINAADATTGLVGTESRNVGGQEIAEFTEVTASGAASPITLTGNTAGKPFTAAVSASTAGDGDLGAPSTTAATGPNHADNADNWTGNALPVDGDTVVFDEGGVSVLYGLDQSSVTPAAITITQGYTGFIGLPETNEDNPSEPYREYRETYLKYGADADATNIVVKIGEGVGSGSGRIKLNTNDSQTTGTVFNSGQKAKPDVPAIVWKGTHASNVLNVYKGDIGIAPFAGETAAIATLRVGFVDNKEGDANVRLGAGVTLTNIDQSGGTLTVNSATTDIDINGGTLDIGGSGAHASIENDGGTVYYRSTGTLATLKVGSGGVVSFARDLQTRTVTNCEITRGASLLDPHKTVAWTNGIDLIRCGVGDVTLDLGKHLTLTPSAI